MGSGRRFLSAFDSLVDRVLCVAGAVLFAQGPEFMQQYLQRLGGHLAEAHRQLAAFHATANHSGITFDRLVSQTAASPDQAVARLAVVMTDAAQRVADLQLAHDALLHAAAWERPFVFLRHADWAIVRGTAAIFKPAVPTTVEGLLYAAAGMIVLLAVYHIGLKRLPRAVLPRRTPPASAAA
jgi:hypothetical protein